MEGRVDELINNYNVVQLLVPITTSYVEVSKKKSFQLSEPRKYLVIQSK
jgi:hypothetical protein